MTQSPFDYGMHKQTFERMHAQILSSMNAADRTFLHTFEAREPDWNLFPEPAIQHLPAVRWKLLNIRKFRQASPVRHAEGLKNLLRVLAWNGRGTAANECSVRRGVLTGKCQKCR